MVVAISRIDMGFYMEVSKNQGPFPEVLMCVGIDLRPYSWKPQYRIIVARVKTPHEGPFLVTWDPY